jgi:hypothetical protein
MRDGRSEYYPKTTSGHEKSQATHGRESHARRKFLGLASLAFAISGVFGLEPAKTVDQSVANVPKAMLDVVVSHDENAPSETPDVYTGEITIQKGVNVRNEPSTLTYGNGPNTVDWGAIKKIGNVELNDASGFILKNAEIAHGFNADTGNLSDGKWVTFKADVDMGIGVMRTKYLYVFLGEETANYVSTDGNGAFVKGEVGSDGNLFVSNNETQINENDINQVTLLNTDVAQSK